MSVDIVDNGGDWSAVSDPAAAVIAAAAAAARFPETCLAGTSVAVALADDAEVAALNAAYRGKSAPTNVLSFPAPQLPAGVPPHDEGGRFIGDIILAAETVMREAADLGISPVHHLQHLTVHGLLHLSGFDHQDHRSAETMEALETRILATLSIADPYAGRPLCADA